MNKVTLAGLLMCLLSAVTQAQNNALQQGDWIARAGLSVTDPDSTGLSVPPDVISADSATSATFTGAYMLSDNLAVELLASWPFEHDIELNGAKIASTKHLPPTLSLQWHQPVGNAGFIPYAGVGINYTIFFDDNISGADLSLDNSVGLAWQIGADWLFDDNWLLNFDLRYIDIETDAKIDGAKLGTVKIDPWIYGVNVGYRF
jgi:outer membrane protein